MSMNFTPAPPNDFPEFIETYYRECTRRMPEIEAIAGKWEFEDLLPGLSDFDSRFVCSDTMSAEDWCRMSMMVGQVHLDMCRLYPKWDRILEHLPGINLTWKELAEESTYYPEYKQWTFYHTSRKERLKEVLTGLKNRPWDFKDEYFHLKKFLVYYGPYDRSIDTPINLGVYENKYPLHSRLMHYFTPPLQSAVCICRKESIAGKMESLRRAARIFPKPEIFKEIIDLVTKHYEVGEFYREPALSKLEAGLFEGLQMVADRLGREISIIPGTAGEKPEEWRNRLKNVKTAPALTIFDNAKFARLMKGRLYFYVNSPTHFDHTYLIRWELKRIGSNFFRVPFGLFWNISTGEKTDDPAEIVKRITPAILTPEEAECTLEFDRLTRLDFAGREEETARKVMDVYDGFYRALHKISREVQERGK